MSEPTAPAQDQFTRLPSGIRVCYRVDGRPGRPAILLIGGLGEDLTMWSEHFVAGLVSRGFVVVRMDNRDSGRSTFVSTRAPGVLRLASARPRSDAYTLTDCATDCAYLIDHLGVGPVHLVGRSMGGMIAQTIAAEFPTRAASLTSIYSTTGNPEVGRASLRTTVILATQSPRTKPQAIKAHLRLTANLAGVGYPIDEIAEAEHAATQWDRTAGDGHAGMQRQLQAILASGDRTAALNTIQVPTLVVNGDRDPLVDPSGGEATAAAIPGSRHLVIAGMGHHIPDSLADVIVEHIAAHVDKHRATQQPTQRGRGRTPTRRPGGTR
ncbi:alpha/beta hydrolase [Nocardia neocaledoniensis NBRC 108232]|uniref:Pimeloyl-ACP methyl ester carboxylesterase n=1 Tax=Nocardia neocaledoniensis TaxID=236511 RepID=A0A317N1L2_9NOCA|nr:alpha/beta fold hydrolase [Nocardia neocaledoniensis]PWV67784.1 pimeloyl-ACP methyl ester carboxylesterase [Nocardia neocaledoniensis]GEM30996.1 alpha/beta hydrolase [Nocardia neocaledoniensis NBRC 108232]